MFKEQARQKMERNLPDSLKAKIAKRSRDKGSNYEREVAKKIAAHFGWKWDKAFFRTKPHGMAQPNGDIQPINEMYELWKAEKLGPLECKNRKEWSFDNLFKNPENSYLYKYWKKSNEDTESQNTVLFFTKPSVTDYVMFNSWDLDLGQLPHIQFVAAGEKFFILTLKDFLDFFWSK